MNGHSFKEALEAGIAVWPKYDGRWPLTSGIKFKFDPSRPAGQRILTDSLKDDNNMPFDLEKEYVVAIKGFLLAGKDGYDCLASNKVRILQPKEECP